MENEIHHIRAEDEIVALSTDRQITASITEEKFGDTYNQCFDLANYRGNRELKKNMYSVKRLRKILEIIEAAGHDDVMLETPVEGEAPIILTGVTKYTGENDDVTAICASRIYNDYDTALEDAAENLVNYSVSSIDGDWTDTYKNEEKAVKAAEEHHYFTGNGAEVVSPMGETVKTFGEVE